MRCRKRSSRGASNTYTKKQSALGFLELPLWAAQNGHLHILEYLVERKFDKYSVLRVVGGHERPLGLFEVLTRNRQSALDLSGGTLGAREQPPECVQYLLYNDCPLPPRLAIRRWRVTRARIRIRIRIITLVLKPPYPFVILL